MSLLEHLIPLDNGLLKSLHEITDPLMLGMMENNIVLEDTLNRDDYQSFVTAGKDVANAGKRFSSKYVAKEMENGKWQMPDGKLVTLAFSGAASLWVAYQTGKRFRKLQLKEKLVVAACFVGGAITGALVAKLTLAPNRGVMASKPAMLSGAVVGVLVVGVAVAVGYIVGENDRLKEAHQKDMNKLQEENKALKEELTKVKTELTGVKTELTEIKTMLKEERKEKEALKTELTGVKTELTEIKGELNEVKEMLREERTNHQIEKAEWERRHQTEKAEWERRHEIEKNVWETRFSKMEEKHQNEKREWENIMQTIVAKLEKNGNEQ